jgi:hypothetical protein
LIGTIPASIGNLANLQQFLLYINQFSGLPLLPSVMPKNARIQQNQFTFDDIIPNLSHIATYSPQNNIGPAKTTKVNLGNTFTFNLGIDSSLAANTYQWYKNGLPFTTTSLNKLVINNVTLADTGVYTCTITNPGVPGLTLSSNPDTLVVNIRSTMSTVTINTSAIGSGYTYTISGTGVGSKQFTTGGRDSVSFDGTINNIDLYLHINNGPNNNASDLKFNFDKQNGISDLMIQREGSYVPCPPDLFRVSSKVNLTLLPFSKIYTSAAQLNVVLKDGILLTPANTGNYDLLRIAGLEQVNQFRIKIFTLSNVLVFDTSDKANFWNGKDMNTNLPVPKGAYKYTILADDKTLSGQFIVDYP